MAPADRATLCPRVLSVDCGIAIVLLWVLLVSFSSPLVAQQKSEVDEAGRATELLRFVEENNLDAAEQAVAEIDITQVASTRTLAAIVKTARQCTADGRTEAAAEVFHTAAALSEAMMANPEPGLPVEKAIAIWHAAAGALTSTGRHADALRWLSLAAEHGQNPATNTRTGGKLLAVASGALDADDNLTAGHSYRHAIEMLKTTDAAHTGPSIATARLGYAWTLVMAAGESGKEEHLRQSLEAVETFLKHHPKHPDAASAMLLQLSCQTQLGAEEEAETTRVELIQKHPRSSSTAEMIVMACTSRDEAGQREQAERGGQLSETMREYLIEQHEFLLTSHSTGASVDVVKTALFASAVAGAPAAESAYAAALSLCDEVGDAATDVLQRLQERGHDSAAQRIAMRWLAARDESHNDPQGLIAKMQHQTGVLSTGAVREAACRWAGRTGDWSMLALAASEEPGLYDQAVDEANQEQAFRRGRTLHVERLFAESLLQTGKTKQSLKLWERIVDEHGADDFSTLLRLAETSVAVGTVANAKTRIAAAQAVAIQRGAAAGGTGNSSPEVALTDLLAANLEIRQLRFDHGRALLERIVRSSRADSNLRGRAQWMIGETFFMQEKFSEAIAAYRQVEAIGSSDQWTAAALVQAGKSFEQLGRTREAAVCYSTLVSRFGDSPHAGGARRRLAAMTTDGPSAPGSIRR